MLAEVGHQRRLPAAARRRQPGAHDVIGDRALGDEPMRVAALGRALLDGLEAGGVSASSSTSPATAAPAPTATRSCRWSTPATRSWRSTSPRSAPSHDAPMAMTAHVLYPAWDAETAGDDLADDHRRGDPRRIGFDGLLMSDDLGDGGALGHLAERAPAAIAAGCDVVLHCSGALGGERGRSPRGRAR